MKTVRGDLLELALEGRFDVVIHGCNCQNSMAAGIAKTIRNRFPEAYEADQRTAKGSREKLGTFSSAVIQRGDVSFVLVNAYTQFHYRGRGVLADYDAIGRVMRSIREAYRGKRFGYPKIGAGLAMGDWPTIVARIDEAFEGEDHTLVELPDG
jgi:O-acetyl-ADP-ribose deacetylase (regulator of RNase III)